MEVGRIRRRAITHGLPGESQADLEGALFHDGLTTQEQADEMSGRGVGTSSALCAYTALGGEVSVDSCLGLGTTFHFGIPVDLLGSQSTMHVEFLSERSTA
jgi:two-component system sensor histidine kinase and response regulator WspE